MNEEEEEEEEKPEELILVTTRSGKSTSDQQPTKQEAAKEFEEKNNEPHQTSNEKTEQETTKELDEKNDRTLTEERDERTNRELASFEEMERERIRNSLPKVMQENMKEQVRIVRKERMAECNETMKHFHEEIQNNAKNGKPRLLDFSNKAKSKTAKNEMKDEMFDVLRWSTNNIAMMIRKLAMIYMAIAKMKKEEYTTHQSVIDATMNIVKKDQQLNPPFTASLRTMVNADGHRRN